MQHYAIFVSLAAATLGSCMPSQQANVTSVGANTTKNSSPPLSPDQAASVFTQSRFHDLFTLPKPVASPYVGQPTRVKVVSVPMQTDAPLNANAGSASFPADGQFSFHPANQMPFNETSTSNHTFDGLTTRQACDPGQYCCPDPRYIFEDSNYPWRAIGRVQSPDGKGGVNTCAGTLVGPHHILTASHCIDWTQDSEGLIGWVSFEPEYWSGNPNYWKYYGTHTQGGPGTQRGDPTSQEGIGSDFVVVVLDVPRGNTGLGWLGRITYDKAWDNMYVWSQVGYPRQLSPDYLAPYSEPPFPVLNAWTPGAFQNEHGYAIQFGACISPGDSGGPLFATFSSGPCTGPCIIGVTSGMGCLGGTWDDWTGRCGNYAAGGSDMVNLIAAMLAKYP